MKIFNFFFFEILNWKIGIWFSLHGMEKFKNLLGIDRFSWKLRLWLALHQRGRSQNAHHQTFLKYNSWQIFRIWYGESHSTWLNNELTSLLECTIYWITPVADSQSTSSRPEIAEVPDVEIEEVRSSFFHSLLNRAQGFSFGRFNLK